MWSVDFWLLGPVVMTNRLQSKSWSCSELVRGAAQVVDAMPAQSLDAMVVEEKHKLLTETSELSASELEKLLQDSCLLDIC